MAAVSEAQRKDIEELYAAFRDGEITTFDIDPR
jgi:hypothetical protein